MRNIRRSLLVAVFGAMIVSAPVLAPRSALAHTDPCHTDHTCPSDVNPPEYVCGDNATGACTAPNSPQAGAPNAAPPLSGPPSSSDCESYEIFYDGSICKQVLGVATPTASGSVSPSPSATDGVSGSPSVAPATSFPPFTVPPPLEPADLDPASLTTVVLALWAVLIAGSVFILVATWRVFTKARQPGWAAIVPIYNQIVYLKLAGRPWWWIFIVWLVIPVFIVNSDLARAFGRSAAFGLGLTLLPFVFLPILAFGPDRYVGARR